MVSLDIFTQLYCVLSQAPVCSLIHGDGYFFFLDLTDVVANAKKHQSTVVTLKRFRFGRELHEIYWQNKKKTDNGACH